MPSFSHKGCMSGHAKGNCCEKASPLASRINGSKGDTKVPKYNRSPHQESPLPASCMRDRTQHVKKEWPVNAEHSSPGSPGGCGNFMVGVFSNTNLCAQHSKRVTIKGKDLVLACCIWGIGMQRAYGRLLSRSNIQLWQKDGNWYGGGRGEGNGNNDFIGKSNGHGNSDRDEERARARNETLTVMAMATATKMA